MEFYEAIELSEAYVFNKQKTKDNENIKIIQNEVKKVVENIKGISTILKGYSLKGHELRLNISNLEKEIGYSQMNAKAKSDIIQKIRKSLLAKGISMKRVNDYFIVDLYNKKKNEIVF
mgnify:CR=1 FL=1